MSKITREIEIDGRKLVLETGELARQAGGAVKVSYGDTVVLAACCTAEAREGQSFFPLTVDYRERTYAAGKIPGGFFKREGRPQEKEIITSRLIDRPIRPLFPDGYVNEVQIIVTVLSSDGENDSDIPALVGASCATALSDAPFQGPVGAVRIGKVDGEYIVNPTFSQLESSTMNIIVAGKESAVTMLEGEAFEASETEILEAIEASRDAISKIVEAQKSIIDEVSPVKAGFTPPKIDDSLMTEVRELASGRITDTFKKALGKQERSSALKEIRQEIIDRFESGRTEDEEDRSSDIKEAFGKLEKEILRCLIRDEKLRVDGRKPDELRKITCSVGVLPRTHGSAIFTKEETQSLAVTTLGTGSDQQVMDELEGEYKKHFMLHYNFPPYSVGEARFLRGPGRREIGHGLLAEKAILPMLESKENFPYTIRLVSDILESNGSSSMATVCAGSMALMDAGVPLKSTVAGVGMGIIEDVILTDMVGDEDHSGDMDFKVAGSRNGVTAIQMDIKVEGISREVLERALEQARAARIRTIDELEKAIPASRTEFSPYAPQLATLQIKPDKIGSLIGPGGKHIKGIQEDTGADIDVEDDGTVIISAESKEDLERAEKLVRGYTDDVEPGTLYDGTVKKIMEFGAFVEVLPGKEGLVHISELAPYRVGKVTDILSEGDSVRVKCLEIDDRGRINLSRVAALTPEEVNEEKKEHYGD